ncbi:vesicular, overexpressed in cancer, prosurvival protein 1 [Orycteropus afer afer]|uniref:Vesicular, overexpressed in cancer, prosurvival protein 1 n=1 Tax=Orycteropus afer afer TaxID=1230840 RepID=A0AC54ZAD4_ORYAF|nr:vesicular, overexpressed in cancer, prosurvival protein 1 [Orycteropus afer afer]
MGLCFKNLDMINAWNMQPCFLAVRDFLVKKFEKHQRNQQMPVKLLVGFYAKLEEKRFNMQKVCTEAKKHCWYFEGLYPTYYICRSYEDCCGSRCCVRALSIQRLWYFWFLLMMGVLFCCGAGFFIRRRMYPPPLIEEPAFNVSYTRQLPNPSTGVQQPGPPYYTDPGGPGMNPAGNPMAMAFQVQPNSPQGSTAYPPPPSYCNTPPPPYEQVVKAK